uniref:Peptidase S1 domain-containing protein n=1 Tax=Meloidogyne hapla TaxID=6305 RepID=A0A1I8B9B0_MELHA
MLNFLSKTDAASKKKVLEEYFIHIGSICVGDNSALRNCKLPEHAIKYTIKNATYQHYFDQFCVGRDYAIIELGHSIPYDQNTNKKIDSNEKITIPANIANHICLIHLDEKVKLNWKEHASPVVFGWGQCN